MKFHALVANVDPVGVPAATAKQAYDEGVKVEVPKSAFSVWLQQSSRFLFRVSVALATAPDKKCRRHYDPGSFAEETREASPRLRLVSREKGGSVSKSLANNVAGQEGRSIPRTIGPVLLWIATLVVALAVSLGAGSPAKAAPTQYFSGAIPPEWVEDVSWNYWSYNEAFNCWCSGPLVGVKQKLTDGSEVRYYTGYGEIDICGSGIYSRTLCGNLSSGTISITCYRETGPC